MAGSFNERLSALQEEVGSGHLVATLVVDQVYQGPGGTRITNTRALTYITR